jgi:hypothetical protein
MKERIKVFNESMRTRDEREIRSPEMDKKREAGTR